MDGPVLEPVTIGGGQKSVNFGPGVEMLMNPNKQSKSGQPKSDIKLSEINDLDDIDISDKPSSSINKKDFLFNSTSNLSDSNPIQLNFESPLEEIKVDNAPSLIGSLGKTESTDGFKSFTEIPVNPQIKVPDKPKLTGKHY